MMQNSDLAAMTSRFLITTLVVWPMLAIYMAINHHQTGAATPVETPSWVPFSPGFFPIYVSMMFVTWLLPVAIADQGRFRACMLANVCAWVLVAPWWVLMPTTMARPPSPTGVWAESYHWLWSVDEPFNITPCAHGVGPVIAVWFAAHARPSWRWPLATILAIGLPSIALVWQHRPIDIFLGTIAAALGIAAAEAVRRYSHAGVTHSPLSENTSPRETSSTSS
jgi:hypothetical protein